MSWYIHRCSAGAHRLDSPQRNDFVDVNFTIPNCVKACGMVQASARGTLQEAPPLHQAALAGRSWGAFGFQAMGRSARSSRTDSICVSVFPSQ
jgi:hypothetical protein